MSKIVKSTIGLMVMTLFSKILGFGRELALTNVYGPGAVSDAFITSMNIPIVVFATIGTALSTTFIPLYYEVMNEKGEQGSLNFTNNIFNIVIVISIVLSLLGFVFAEELTKIFAIDFSGDKLVLATKFTKIMIFSLVFIGLSNLMTCWLQIKGNFIVPGMISIPYNIIIIIAIIISFKSKTEILAIGVLIATFIQFLFQVPFAIKHKYRYSLKIDLKSEYVKKMYFLVIPVFIGVGVNQINAVVDRSLASTLGDGIITVLNSANKLNQFVVGLFILTISAVVYPKLSKLSSGDIKGEFLITIKKCINIIILIIMPITIGAIVLSIPIVKLVFQRGEFTANDTNLTAIALIGYSLGMLSVGINDILNRIFYSLKDTKTPMIVGGLTMFINVFLNIILMKKLGHFGLAISTSISATICILILFAKLNRKLGYFGQNEIIKTSIKSLLASITMGIIVGLSYRYIASILNGSFIFEFISLFTSICIGACIYTMLLLILKVDEAIESLEMVRLKIEKIVFANNNK